MPDSVFNVTAPSECSVFAPEAGYGADTVLTFFRSTLRQNNALPQPRLTSAGETSLSYASAARYLLSLQPKPSGYVRMVQGIVTQVAFVAFVEGNADVIEGDRCTVSARRLEVASVLHYGTESTEIELVHLGR